MKIIQIITLGHEIYGAQKHVLELSWELQKDGHEVLVVVGTQGAMTDWLKQKNIRYIVIKSLKRSLNPFYDIICIFKLIKLFKDERPDIISSHSSKAGIVTRIAAWWCKIPNTFTAHGWSFAEGIPQPNRTFFLWIERVIGFISYKIIAVAEVEREYGIKKRVASPDKIVTIHYGINKKYSYNKSFEKSETQSPFVITMVAGFRPQKDHATLLKALQDLQKFDWVLYLLGDGELEGEIKRLAHYLKIEHRIKFEGAVSNVEDYLIKTDLMVLTTNWEGLPISILEGLSYGLPIIATDVAGVKEEVIDGYNGKTVKRGDWLSVKKAIEELFHNQELRILYGKNSRILFEECFTTQAMYKKTISLYESMTLK